MAFLRPRKLKPLREFFSSTGSRYEMNFGGSSLIGKCPSPFMIMASAPVRLATSNVPSVVQE